MAATRNKLTASTQHIIPTTLRTAQTREKAAVRTSVATAKAPPQKCSQAPRHRFRPVKQAEIMAVDPAVPTGPPSRQPGKLAMIEALLHRPGGANIAELCEATTWQAHSIRAALTGLRKVGHAVQRERGKGGTTGYRIINVPISK